MCAGLGACDAGEPASAPQCQAIFERLVVLELREMGFDDPALAERMSDALSARFASEVAECVGKPLPPGAMACVAAATSAEQISHECLH